ncbi:MAG: hypothetical protein N2691_02840 [Patescibacteria group bacterium]|nr:hypothetical protein [Patescibacteria group bacterium]
MSSTPSSEIHAVLEHVTDDKIPGSQTEFFGQLAMERARKNMANGRMQDALDNLRNPSAQLSPAEARAEVERQVEGYMSGGRDGPEQAANRQAVGTHVELYQKLCQEGFARLTSKEKVELATILGEDLAANPNFMLLYPQFNPTSKEGQKLVQRLMQQDFFIDKLRGSIDSFIAEGGLDYTRLKALNEELATVQTRIAELGDSTNAVSKLGQNKARIDDLQAKLNDYRVEYKKDAAGNIEIDPTTGLPEEDFGPRALEIHNFRQQEKAKNKTKTAYINGVLALQMISNGETGLPPGFVYNENSKEIHISDPELLAAGVVSPVRFDDIQTTLNKFRTKANALEAEAAKFKAAADHVENQKNTLEAELKTAQEEKARLEQELKQNKDREATLIKEIGEEEERVKDEEKQKADRARGILRDAATDALVDAKHAQDEARPQIEDEIKQAAKDKVRDLLRNGLMMTLGKNRVVDANAVRDYITLMKDAPYGKGGEAIGLAIIKKMTDSTYTGNVPGFALETDPGIIAALKAIEEDPAELKAFSSELTTQVLKIAAFKDQSRGVWEKSILGDLFSKDEAALRTIMEDALPDMIVKAKGDTTVREKVKELANLDITDGNFADRLRSMSKNPVLKAVAIAVLLALSISGGLAFNALFLGK